MYALVSRQESEASPNIVTGTLQFFSLDVNYFLDSGSTLSYVAPYVAICIDFGPEVVLDPFFIST